MRYALHLVFLVVTLMSLGCMIGKEGEPSESDRHDEIGNSPKDGDVFETDRDDFDSDSFRAIPLRVQRTSGVHEGILLLFTPEESSCVDSGFLVFYKSIQANTESLIDVSIQSGRENYRKIKVRSTNPGGKEATFSRNDIVLFDPVKSSFTVLEDRLQVPCKEAEAIKYCKEVFESLGDNR
ncbi:hypothetical protein GC197_12510 [bacterium]|nr:hypothetical protein [bacterium]